jgi:transcriptional regulator with XRE-family HTH domain
MVDRNWSQSDLARQAGLGRDSISQYMVERSLPSPENAERLARAFGFKEVRDLYPDSFLASVDSVPAAIEVKQLPDNPQRAHLRVNKEMPFRVAAQIIDILSSVD